MKKEFDKIIGPFNLKFKNGYMTLVYKDMEYLLVRSGNDHGEFKVWKCNKNNCKFIILDHEKQGSFGSWSRNKQINYIVQHKGVNENAVQSPHDLIKALQELKIICDANKLN